MTFRFEASPGGNSDGDLARDGATELDRLCWMWMNCTE